MRFFLLICLIAFPAFANAQVPFSPDDDRIFHGGLSAGANFSQVDGDGFSGYHKVGIAAHATVYIHFAGMLHGSLGLGYSEKGAKEASIRDSHTGPAVFRYTMRLKYAELPLMLHLIGGRGLHYSGGFYYARLISSKESSEHIYPINISPELYPFRKQDFGGIFGIGLHVKDKWFIRGEYQYTIGSIRSEPYIPPGYGHGRQRNNVMTIRLLYIIPSGRAR